MLKQEQSIKNQNKLTLSWAKLSQYGSKQHSFRKITTRLYKVGPTRAYFLFFFNRTGPIMVYMGPNCMKSRFVIVNSTV